MRTPLLCALGLAAMIGISSPAQAQNKGFQLNRYEPTAAGEFSFSVDHPWYNLRSFAAGITLNYGHSPLQVGLRSNDTGSFTTQSVLIEHQLIGHLDLAGAIANRVLISFSLPFTLLERGDSDAAAALGVKLVTSAAVGDPRFGVMFRVAGDPYKSPISLSLGGYVWVPINSGGTFPAQTGETGFRVLPKLVLGGLGHHVLWSLTGGFYYRPDASLGSLPPGPGNSVGAEVQLGGAIAYADMERRFSVGPEVVMHTDALDGKAFKVENTNLEALVGFNYNAGRVVQLGLAGGVGLLRGPGTPDGRVLFRLAYAPMASDKPVDRDNDGIADFEDACPTEPGVRTGVPATNGCPPPPADRDHDGVVDPQDICPDEPAGGNPDAEKPGCPLRDTDADGVFDNQDQCPSEPAGLKPDPQKPGCPLRDKDGDGVYDNEDQCIEIAAGPHPSTSRKGCPDQDSDHDGIYDSKDQCPDVAAGLNPDPQKLGCPLADRDHDQVPDNVDACPDQPGSFSPDPKRNGCPGLVEVRGSQIIIKEQVFFATNKDVVLKRSFGLLDAVAHTLVSLKQIKKLGIEGHTDNKGKPELNTQLSDRRAKSVMAYLVAKGVAAGRLEAKGFGPTQPIADNKTDKGRSLNRRVDFQIIDPPQVKATPATVTVVGTPAPAQPVLDKPAAAEKGKGKDKGKGKEKKEKAPKPEAGEKKHHSKKKK